MYEALCKELDVQFKRIGSITVANSEDELVTLGELAQRSEAN